MAADLSGREYDEYLGEIERPDYDGVSATSLYECRTCFAAITSPERHRAAAHPDS